MGKFGGFPPFFSYSPLSMKNLGQHSLPDYKKGENLGETFSLMLNLFDHSALLT